MPSFNFELGQLTVEKAMWLIGIPALVIVGWMIWEVLQFHTEMERESTSYRQWCASAGGEVITSSNPWLCVKPGSLIKRPQP